jgi:2-keto-4-pentenoate hydratase/2-oxohepta-3-ene-1,7-dioic acid hydratase in catechol pathway
MIARIGACARLDREVEKMRDAPNLAEVRLLAPVAWATKTSCIGLNYAGHAAEAGL